MQVASQNNCEFNPEKIKCKLSELVFLGNIVSHKGQKPCPDKVKAIVDMPNPQNREELRRLMGMFNYLSQFIPNMAQHSEPLRRLLKKDSAWVWQKEQEDSLKLLKNLISSQPVLHFFDPTKTCVIQCDASSGGLGACLLQEGHPIAFASRSLTGSEINYSQIEKEMLAIVFPVLKFHQYIYGLRVEVQSDHKPLEMIKKKPLHKASPRLQQMLLKLMRYNLDVKYHPGKHMHIADTLSRAYNHNTDSPAEDDNLELFVHSVTESLPISEKCLKELKL